MADAVTKATLRVRAQLLAELAEKDLLIESSYVSRIKVIRRKIAGLKPNQPVTKFIAKEMRELSRELVPIVSKLIEDGTKQGERTGREQFEAVFEDEPDAPKVRTSAERMVAVGKQIRGQQYVDNVPLSKRIWSNNDLAGEKMGVSIEKSIRGGEKMNTIAKRILKVQPPNLQMPEYIRELSDAARLAHTTGEKDEFRKVLDKYRGKLDDLGSVAGTGFSMGPPTKRLISALRGAGTKQIDAALRRYMTEKAERHTRMIARTETIHSYREGYYDSIKGKPWNKGIRWNLSGSHPDPDICDVLANQDLHGLGPGGYPQDAIPENPHPNCLCYQTAIMDKEHFTREKAKRRGENPPEPWKSGEKVTAAEWLDTKPKKFQRKLLGPTRLQLVKKNPSLVFNRRGEIAPVRLARKRAERSQMSDTQMREATALQKKMSPVERPTIYQKLPKKLAVVTHDMTPTQAQVAIKNQPFEHMVIYDTKGRVLLRTTQFSSNEVGVTKEENDWLLNQDVSWVIHNHPSENAYFSWADINFSHKYGAGIVAVAPSGAGMELSITDADVYNSTSHVGMQSVFESAMNEAKFKSLRTVSADQNTDDVLLMNIDAWEEGGKFYPAFQEAYRFHMVEELNKSGKDYGFHVKTTKLKKDKNGSPFTSYPKLAVPGVDLVPQRAVPALRKTKTVRALPSSPFAQPWQIETSYSTQGREAAKEAKKWPIKNVEEDQYIHPLATLAEAEDTIRNNGIEHYAAWDSRGRMVMRKRGSGSSVDFTGEEKMWIDNADGPLTGTHNHSNHSCFSGPDVGHAAQYRYAEFRAVTPEGTWILRPRDPDRIDETWDRATEDLTDLGFEASKANEDAMRETSRIISTPTQDKDGRWHDPRRYSVEEEAKLFAKIQAKHLREKLGIHGLEILWEAK